MRRTTSSSATKRTSATRAAVSGTTAAFGVEPSGACVGNVFNFAGNNLPYAPEYQRPCSTAHEFPLPGGAAVVPRIRASYFDEMFLGWENRTDRPAGTLSPTDPGEKEFGLQPAYTMVDAAIAFRSSTDQWTAEAFITNATG